nr:MAG TPA_asm: hypothetical protein [Caudoviricetes sp.]
MSGGRSRTLVTVQLLYKNRTDLFLISLTVICSNR